MKHLGWKRTAAFGVAAAVLAGVVWGWPRPVSPIIPPPRRQPGAYAWLSVSDGHIVDPEDRTVLLRGFNVDNLTDARDDELGPPTPLDDRDAQLMQQAGFNSVRLPFAWSLLEPRRGAFDNGYLAKIVATVRLLERHHLRVILDMHFGQAWGPSADVPLWASLDWVPDFRPVQGKQWNATISTRNAASYTYFWTTKDWQADLAQAWRLVASQFRGDPGVVGYDIYNEAHPLPIPPGLFGARFLFPFYAHMISSIATVDPNHLFFVESTLFVGLATTVEPILARNIVYSPHLYAGSLDNLPFQKATPSLIGSRVRMRVGEGRTVGGALWFGELGVDRQHGGAGALENSYLNSIEAQHAGWSWWEWRADGGWGIRDVAGNHIDLAALRRLARPYLTRAPHGVVTVNSDDASMTIRVDARHVNQEAVVAWPGLLAGPPHATGSCLVSSAWDPASERVRLMFAPGQHCLVYVR